MTEDNHAWLKAFTVAVDMPTHLPLTRRAEDGFRSALFSATRPYSHRIDGPDRDEVMYIYFRPTVQGEMADPQEMVDRVAGVFEQFKAKKEEKPCGEKKT
jgi:hypothetical protein